MGLFAHGWMKLTHYSILVLAKINENLLYWKKPVKFNDLHICSFFTYRIAIRTTCKLNWNEPHWSNYMYRYFEWWLATLRASLCQKTFGTFNYLHTGSVHFLHSQPRDREDRRLRGSSLAITVNTSSTWLSLLEHLMTFLDNLDGPLSRRAAWAAPYLEVILIWFSSWRFRITTFIPILVPLKLNFSNRCFSSWLDRQVLRLGIFKAYFQTRCDFFFSLPTPSSLPWSWEVKRKRSSSRQV